MKIVPGEMQAAAGAAEDLLKALANRHRLMILCQIFSGERAVGELAALLDLRSSTVSQHLALLRKEGLVSARRDGQTIWYSIASAAAHRLIETLYDVYCAPKPASTSSAAKRTVSKTKGEKQK